MTFEHQKEARTFRTLMSQPCDLFSRDVAPMQSTLISEEYNEFLEAHCEALAISRTTEPVSTV